MKRLAAPFTGPSTLKRARIGSPASDDSGETQRADWPAKMEEIEAARRFILECATAKTKTLIVPDKDADGLASGSILQQTLVLLGLPSSLITTHLVQRGNNIHDPSERAAMADLSPSYVFVLDQGSRRSLPVVDIPNHRALIIDHHQAAEDEFPSGSQHVTACNSPPVATSALLTYLICHPLHPAIEEQCAWLAVLGTHGDLGTNFKWQPPFPDMGNVLKRYTRKRLNDAVSLINAPRRTAAYNVPAAWEALTQATGPADLLANKALWAARAEVNAEVERCTHVPPKFSTDGRVAVLRMKSKAQVHPVIATRWAGHLKSAKLEVVMAANDGYLEGKVNFSCRVAKCARERRGGRGAVNIIELLNGIVEVAEDPSLKERLGESFARGHKEASGGVVPTKEFEEMMALMGVGAGSRKKLDPVTPVKKENTITNYFIKNGGSQRH
ncbi:DHH phosphoesterase [Copromyces sp. CBS 386.78]|nr:DHH phosphoesterase [Copromyces sp. CBS 386.78]